MSAGTPLDRQGKEAYHEHVIRFARLRPFCTVTILTLAAGLLVCKKSPSSPRRVLQPRPLVQRRVWWILSTPSAP